MVVVGDRRHLTDFHLSLDSLLAAVAVVDLRFIIVVHDLDKFPRYCCILKESRFNAKFIIYNKIVFSVNVVTAPHMKECIVFFK